MVEMIEVQNHGRISGIVDVHSTSAEPRLTSAPLSFLLTEHTEQTPDSQKERLAVSEVLNR